MENLSAKERKLLMEHPRNMNMDNHCIETTSITNQYTKKRLQAIRFLVHTYINNCTIPLQKALTLASQKYEVSSEEIVNYLEEILLAPYSHKQKHPAINPKIFNKHFDSLEEAKEGLKEYLENPALLLQHLAYCSSLHLPSIENFLSCTLRLPKQSIVFEVANESITLLYLCPNLTQNQNSLIHLLTYRIGTSHDDIYQALNSTIEDIFCARVKNYLKGFGLESENTIFQLCQLKASQIRSANSPMQF